MPLFTDRPLPDGFEVAPIVPRKVGKPFSPKNRGRPKGAVAKITRDLREGIIDAAVIVGSDGQGTGGLTGFLVDLAMNHKRAYASLLAKLLPMQASVDVNTNTVGIQIVSIESGTFLSREECAKATQPRASQLQLEGEIIESHDSEPVETTEERMRRLGHVRVV